MIAHPDRPSTMRRFLLIPALAALSCAVLAQPQPRPIHKTAPDPQELVLHFRAQPGDKQRQTMSMQMQTTMVMTNMLPGPDASEAERAQLAERMRAAPKSMRMDMRSVLRIEASEADAKGDFLLHLRGEGGSMRLSTGDKDSKETPSPQGDMEIDALLNTRHAEVQLLRMKGGGRALQDPRLMEQLAASVIKQSSGTAAGLEGRKMKVGESAEIPFELQLPMSQLPSGGQFKSTLVLTLTGIRQGIARFDTRLDIKMALTPAEGSKKPPVKVEMNGSGKGRLDYRIADRLTLDQRLEMDLLMTVRAPTGSDMQISTKMQMRTRGERLH